ncbi:MAG: YciI family protein [Rhizomicrobium sp.]|jgi:hypothetical protein
MPDFMLFLHQDLGTGPIASPEEMMAVVKEYIAWSDRMRAEGRYRSAERLSNDAGKVLRPKDGRIAVTDGPYAETKEIIGGYYVIGAKDYDEACRISETHPHLKYGGRIEIRQFHPI